MNGKSVLAIFALAAAAAALPPDCRAQVTSTVDRVCRELSAKADDPALLDMLKQVIAQVEDPDLKGRLLVTYSVGCRDAGMDREAAASEAAMRKRLPNHPWVEYLAPVHACALCVRCMGSGQAAAACPDCQGGGKCGTCKGTGSRAVVGFDGKSAKCMTCGGSGKCKRCGGAGKVAGACAACQGKGRAASRERLHAVYLGLLSGALKGNAPKLSVAKEVVLRDVLRTVDTALRDYDKAPTSVLKEQVVAAARNVLAVGLQGSQMTLLASVTDVQAAAGGAVRVLMGPIMGLHVPPSDIPNIGFSEVHHEVKLSMTPEQAKTILPGHEIIVCGAPAVSSGLIGLGGGVAFELCNLKMPLSNLIASAGIHIPSYTCTIGGVTYKQAP